MQLETGLCIILFIRITFEPESQQPWILCASPECVVFCVNNGTPGVCLSSRIISSGGKASECSKCDTLAVISPVSHHPHPITMSDDDSGCTSRGTQMISYRRRLMHQRVLVEVKRYPNLMSIIYGCSVAASIFSCSSIFL